MTMREGTPDRILTAETHIMILEEQASVSHHLGPGPVNFIFFIEEFFSALQDLPDLREWIKIFRDVGELICKQLYIFLRNKSVRRMIKIFRLRFTQGAPG